MPRHPARRLGIIAAIALAVALAGCPGETPVTPTSSKAPRKASPSPRATATATAPLPTLTPGATATPGPNGTASPVAQASPSPGASPSGTPLPVGPPPSGQKLAVGGTVYDEAGSQVVGATVKAKSLDQRAAFEGTATTDGDGRWSIKDVPEGANVEITATKAGFTTRRRVAAFTAGFDASTDFGAAGGKNSAAAAAFISKYPEIALLEPDTAALAAGRIGFKLILSSPLAAADQARFLAAVRVWPANDAAAPEGDADDDDDENLASLPDTGAVLPEPIIENDEAADGYEVDYVVKEATAFLSAGGVKPTGSWSADGTTLTFAFNAPLTRARRENARYHVGLVRGTDAQAMKDTDGDALGTNRHGEFSGSSPLAGNLLRNLFREEVLSIADEDGNGTITAAERWTSTHDTVHTLALAGDDAPPRPTAVKVVKDVSGHFRIELTFSEPMTVYNGKPDGRAHVSLDGDRDRDGFLDDANALHHYTFALGAAAGDTAGVTLNGFTSGTDLDPDPRTVSTFGIEGDRKKEFAFSLGAAAFQRRLENASTGEVIVDVAEDDPRIVRLTIKNRANWLDAGVKELRVRVEDVADPSGQTITGAAADANTLTTAIP